MSYETASSSCPIETIYDIREYYTLYPEYCNPEDFKEYPQLDPMMTLAQLAVINSTRL